MPPRRPSAPLGPSGPPSGASPKPRATGGAAAGRSKPSGASAKPVSAKVSSTGRAKAAPAKPRAPHKPASGRLRSSTPRSAGRTVGVRDADGRMRLVRPVYAVAGVLALLTLLILPDLNRWLVQRSQISDMRQQVSQAEADATGLQAEQQRWKNPDYVRAQARERLHFVMPGETGYVVLEPALPAGATGGTPTSEAAKAVEAADRPWFGDLWGSTEVAGRG